MTLKDSNHDETLVRSRSADYNFWQTSGRLRVKSNQFIQRERDFSSRTVFVYSLKNDTRFTEGTRDGSDTVGVCGSNPHAPYHSFQ